MDAEAVAYHMSDYRRTPTMLAAMDNIHYFVRKHPSYDVEAIHSLDTFGYIMGRIRLREDAVRGIAPAASRGRPVEPADVCEA